MVVDLLQGAASCSSRSLTQPSEDASRSGAATEGSRVSDRANHRERVPPKGSRAAGGPEDTRFGLTPLGADASAVPTTRDGSVQEGGRFSEKPAHRRSAAAAQ